MKEFQGKKYKIGKKSYTIIELIVVVTIVAVLLLIGFVIYSQFIKSSRDAKRKADLEEIKGALEIFKQNSVSGSYPQSLNSEALSDYLNSVPLDPKTKLSYVYTPRSVTCEDTAELTPCCSDLDANHPCTSYSLITVLEIPPEAQYESTPNYAGIITPTLIAEGPTNTPAPPTATTVPSDTPTPTQIPPPTFTPTPTTAGGPTETPIPPTNTPIPPTNTPVPPTNTPVPTLIPGGGACSSDAQCVSGVCGTDADGDGYLSLVLGHTGTCQSSAKPYTDCCDSDANAHPGQLNYYSSQRSGCGGYDYNCDGVETKDTFSIGCLTTMTASCYVTTPAGHPGYATVIPACGIPGTFRICYTCSNSDCTGTTGLPYHYCWQGCPAPPGGGGVKVEDRLGYWTMSCR